jgi:hypothetical protein
MTGAELRHIRAYLGEVVGDNLSYTDMAYLCGLTDPERNGKDTYRKWEDGVGPSGPVAALLSLLVAGLNSITTEVQLYFRNVIIDRVGIEL